VSKTHSGACHQQLINNPWPVPLPITPYLCLFYPPSKCNPIIHDSIYRAVKIVCWLYNGDEMRPQKPNQAEKYLNTMLHCRNDKAAIATCDMDECTRINGDKSP